MTVTVHREMTMYLCNITIQWLLLPSVIAVCMGAPGLPPPWPHYVVSCPLHLQLPSTPSPMITVLFPICIFNSHFFLDSTWKEDLRSGLFHLPECSLVPSTLQQIPGSPDFLKVNIYVLHFLWNLWCFCLWDSSCCKHISQPDDIRTHSTSHNVHVHNVHHSTHTYRHTQSLALVYPRGDLHELTAHKETSGFHP